MEFAEHNIGKGFHVTGIYALNFDEDEFLSSMSLINLTVW
jgi:hypothetical protein